MSLPSPRLIHCGTAPGALVIMVKTRASSCRNGAELTALSSRTLIPSSPGALSAISRMTMLISTSVYTTGWALGV
eukprot:56983-Eustigmatos_ZCMA.PRE.1